MKERNMLWLIKKRRRGTAVKRDVASHESDPIVASSTAQENERKENKENTTHLIDPIDLSFDGEIMSSNTVTSMSSVTQHPASPEVLIDTLTILSPSALVTGLELSSPPPPSWLGRLAPTSLDDMVLFEIALLMRSSSYDWFFETVEGDICGDGWSREESDWGCKGGGGAEETDPVGKRTYESNVGEGNATLAAAIVVGRASRCWSESSSFPG